MSRIKTLDHNFEMVVITEGIELEEQTVFIKECDLKYIQGYLLEKRIYAEEYSNLFLALP